MYEMSAWRRQSPTAYKNHRFTTVSDVRPTRSGERVARPAQKFAFHHSFGRPTITFCVKGCLGHVKKGSLGDVKNLHFTTVLGVRRARSDERVVSRRDPPNLPCGKEKKNFKEEQHFRRAAVSAALLSRFSQQPFSAALLSSSSQQLFSAALLSSSSQQPFSAALLSSSSQQPFSAALLSSSSQLSSCCGQGLVVS